jgi:F-type H+-transporting ATPase subunit a
MNILRYIFIGVILLLTSQYTLASDNKENSEEKFNPVALVMHHIADSHSWVVFNNEHFKLEIPLPVILLNEGHLHFFMSSDFKDEKAIKKGNTFYVLHHNKIYKTDKEGNLEYNPKGEVLNKKPLDLSITKNVASLWISIVILLILFVGIAKKYRNALTKPRGSQSMMEPLILFVRDDIALEMIGKHKGEKFVPYLLTLFFFIWINNLLGIVPIFPGGSNVTGNIAVTAVLAALTLLITNINANKGYWKHIIAPPGVPAWVAIFIVPVEIIGIFTKPFALMMRLFANITAGHIIILSLISIIFIVKSFAFAPVSIALVLFMSLLELLVGFLQAFIFTLLTALFIGMASHEETH